MRYHLYCIFFFLLVFTSSEIFAETYYISQNGDDRNSGLSADKPWKTIRKVREGNTYLLKRGDVLYFRITKLYANEIRNPAENQKIIIDSYGKGAKPVLSLYKTLSTRNWKRVEGDVWKLDMKDGGNFSGFADISNNDIGFLKIDKTIRGNKLIRLERLAKDFDFYTDDQFLYLFSKKDPATFRDMKAAIDRTAVELSNSMTMQNIEITGAGGHGIQGNGVDGVTLRNVDVCEIGGSYLGNRKDGTRYGNGIEFYNFASNCTVTGCSVTDVFDSAYTMQGESKDKYFTNIVFRNNFADRNEQSFEFWVKGGKSGFKNCSFVANRCYRAGYGWAHDVRFDKTVGVHVLNYAWEVTQGDLSIRNNLFSGARNGYIFSRIPANDKSFVSDANTIVLSKLVPIQVRERDSKENISDIKAFISSSGLDRKSKFVFKN